MTIYQYDAYFFLVAGRTADRPFWLALYKQPYVGDIHARNLYKKNLAASRYDRQASFLYKLTCTNFLYKFLVRVSPTLFWASVLPVTGTSGSRFFRSSLSTALRQTSSHAVSIAAMRLQSITKQTRENEF